MIMKRVRVGIMLTFTLVDTNQITDALEPHIINGIIKENVEDNLLPGVLMKVIKVEVDGVEKKVTYGE